MSDSESQSSNQNISARKASRLPLWRLFFFMLVALCALLILYHFKSPLPIPAPQPMPLAAQIIAPAPSDEILATQNKQIGKLTQRIDALEERLNTLSLAPVELENTETNVLSEEARTRIDTLETRLAELQSTIVSSREDGTSRARLLIVFDRLEKQINAGESFEHSLSAFRLATANLMQNSEWIEQLQSYQHEGVSTLTSLQHGLNTAIARFMVQADRDQSSIWESIKHNLSHLVVIRKVGDSHEGMDSQSRIARAEAALKDGEIELAVEEINALAEVDREQFSDWLDNARAWLAVQDTLDKIEAAITDIIDRPITQEPSAEHIPGE